MGRSRHCCRPGIVAAVVLALVVAACSSGDDRAQEPASGDPPGPDRCDLGFNTAAFNDATAEVHADHDMSVMADVGAMGEVDFSLEEWAEVFVDEDLGLTVEEAVTEINADVAYRRQVEEGVLAHNLDPEPWQPMTDRRECEALASELSEARAAATRYATVAQAVADGYVVGDSYFAGLGVHYQNYGYLDEFDPSRPILLQYDGTGEDANLVGLSYSVSLEGDVPPEGFTGENDRWHRHRSFCFDNEGVNLASDALSEEECFEIGGRLVPNPNLWSIHTWVVPGCESDWGVFSAANPRLPYLPDGVRLRPGCHADQPVTSPLAFDGRGNGPRVD